MAALKRNQGRDLARRSGKTGRKQSRDRVEGWVRKTVVMDQRKLDAARRVLGVETDTEAIDVALDLVAFRRKLVREMPPSDARAALKMCWTRQA